MFWWLWVLLIGAAIACTCLFLMFIFKELDVNTPVWLDQTLGIGSISVVFIMLICLIIGAATSM